MLRIQVNRMHDEAYQKNLEKERIMKQKKKTVKGSEKRMKKPAIM